MSLPSHSLTLDGSNYCAKHTSYPDWNEFDAISKLANAKDKDLQQQEITDVCQAFEAATSEYWTTVSKWLNRVFPAALDSVVISGGASRFLEPDLEKHFNCEHKYKYERVNGSYSNYAYFRTGEYRSDDPDKHFTPIIWGAGFADEHIANGSPPQSLDNEEDEDLFPQSLVRGEGEHDDSSFPDDEFG